MKSFLQKFLIPVLILGTCLPATAVTRTVNNSTNLPVNPGQYTDIQSAMNASAAGDTLLVAGTLNNYNTTLTITKRLAIIGAGYNPDKINPVSTRISGSVSITDTAASGLYLAGIDFNGTVNIGQGNAATVYLNNLTFTRCVFRTSVYLNDSTVNFLMSNCIFRSSSFYIQPSRMHYNMQLTNNIFSTPANGYSIYGNQSTSTAYLAIKIDHNLFLGGSNTTPLLNGSTGQLTPSPFSYYMRNAIISNNIFYNVSPVISGSGTNNINNTYNNNISYSGMSFPTMPTLNNIGGGNINNTNPSLTTLFSSSTNIYLDFNADNLRPQAGSPVINAGSDGTDIGPTGGQYPIYRNTNTYLTGEPPLPEVKNVTYISSSAIAPGTNLIIQVKAKKIN